MTCSLHLAARTLAGIRGYALQKQPEISSIDALYADLGAVLEPGPEPAPQDIPHLAARLKGALPALLRRAPAQAPADVLTHIRLHQAAPPPTDLGSLRRLAAAVSDLLDVLLDDLP
ncbi:hypothetical protein IHE61_31145 [Streptomyces sp. GKU 257-1]|nr:hypothetical protein [Streptomyces sp. GKU 257-1]